MEVVHLADGGIFERSLSEHELIIPGGGLRGYGFTIGEVNRLKAAGCEGLRLRSGRSVYSCDFKRFLLRARSYKADGELRLILPLESWDRAPSERFAQPDDKQAWEIR